MSAIEHSSTLYCIRINTICWMYLCRLQIKWDYKEFHVFPEYELFINSCFSRIRSSNCNAGSYRNWQKWTSSPTKLNEESDQFAHDLEMLQLQVPVKKKQIKLPSHRRQLHLQQMMVKRLSYGVVFSRWWVWPSVGKKLSSVRFFRISFELSHEFR
jgi:hypothetical protein